MSSAIRRHQQCFAGTFPVELSGRYDVTVYAYDPASGNTGVDHLTVTVTEE